MHRENAPLVPARIRAADERVFRMLLAGHVGFARSVIVIAATPAAARRK
jgi:hypothetical protein